MSDQPLTEQEAKEAIKQMASASVENLKKIFTTPPADKTWEEIEERMAQGENLQSICNVSDSYMESNYADAKDKLEHKEFDKARDVFANLCVLNQQTIKYWGGLAKSCEGLKLYKEAAECYKLMTLLSGGSNPLTYLGMGFCQLMAGDKGSALESLEAGQEVADPMDADSRQILLQIEELITHCK